MFDGERPSGHRVPVSDPTTSVPPVKEQRRITAMSAILLPHTAEGAIDWTAFEAHVGRTVEAGLAPAVNMDTGFVQLLDPATRTEVLDRTVAITDDFIAGAFVADNPGAPFDRDGYLAAIEAIASRGGTPVVFPSHGLNEQPEDALIAALADIGTRVDRFIGFELGPMFVPYGRIYSLDGYRALLAIPSCIGAKHSSLARMAEWERLSIRDRVRPDFAVLTGNDLAIDMVMYGSDYLLGLSTFAPAEFALRDHYWETGDPRFYQLNDLLQYLGYFTFRRPVPAYRHNAAVFFELRGWASSSRVPEGAPIRPDSDRAVLADILDRLGEFE